MNIQQPITDEQILETIANYLKQKLITWSDFADELGIARENLSRWRAGRPISPKIKKKLLGWLMPDLIANEQTEMAKKPGNVTFVNVAEKFKSVPLLTTAQAKELDPHGLGTVDDIPEGATIMFDNVENGDFAVQISGNSMMPWYPPGTRVLVTREWKPRTGDRVIASIADCTEPLFKVYIDMGGKFALYSISNRDGCDPIILDKMDRTETWYWIYPIKSSFRDERAVDNAMKDYGVHHGWEKWLEEVQEKSTKDEI